MRVSSRPALHSRGLRPAAGIAGVLAVLLGGCGGSHANGPYGASASGSSRGGSARIERREVDNHPPINLVVRLGDPLPAVAFASAHDRGAVASVALSALILARLSARGIGEVVSVPTAHGIELAVLSADRAAARAFIEQVTAALATPIAERDDALRLVQEHLAALRSRAFTGKAEAGVAECSGELGQLPGAAVPDLSTPAGRAELEGYRRFAFATRASAFAALGSSEFVNAAASELEQVPDWPNGDAPEDAWPTSDAAEADSAEGTRRLSVALRVADADAALASLRTLSTRRATLASRLRSFLPGFTLERVAFQARPRGACLRVDLSLPEGEPGVTPKETALAVTLVTEEAHAPESAAPGAIEENIIEPSDPRQAAARAAWRALTGQQEPGPERRMVAVTVHPAERPAFSGFANSLREFETRPQRAPLETRLRAEPGQAELWILLGSPCGTLAESNDNAGQSALALTMAAHETSADVALEPWITPDAVGLLAHAPRRALESASEQAERVARALARALSERSAAADALATAQSELFLAVGGAPRPGYARLLDALAPDHRAWLEPRGTWASLAEANRDGVAARGREVLHGPLRVAVLANEDNAQAEAATRALDRWFAPWREDPRRCQTSAERAARSGELTITVPDSANTESAYLGLPFPSRVKFEREAEAFAMLLNAPRGPLALALSAEHINASARASIIGGGRAAALVIEIRASDEDARKATLEVRRALDRFVASQLSNDDLAAAQRVAAQRGLGASLDPRRRIVDLWRGGAAEGTLSRSSLRAFQAALSGAAQVVVYVTHRD
ncbi:MAG TPA: hypothetical protein VJV79_10485 [Polyangiaceae bacterium]|nr:hypothetical protein [Polyangiaceae bacterium]